MSEQIVLQSAFSLAVAFLAFMMAVAQFFFVLKKPLLTFYGWGAVIALSGMLYAGSVFLEYNTPPGSLNHLAGLLEFTAHVFLIHSLYGLTFDYLKIDGKRYHLFAGIFHVLLLILLWSSNLIVSNVFVARKFFFLDRPFEEPALGPLGPLFILYIAVAAIVATIFWFRYKGPPVRYRKAYLSGLIFWIVLGMHDGLAALGMPTIQYIMEYGFLGFSAVVLWIVFDSYGNLLMEDKYRVITEFANDGILVIQDDKTVFENPACSALFGRPVGELMADDFILQVIREDREKLVRYYEGLMHAQKTGGSLIIRIERDNGEEKFLEIRANVIRYRNRPAILTILRDVTERIHEEAVLRDHEEKIARLKKMESLGLLAGGVAHDLNNVLTGVVSYPDLMLRSLPEDSNLRKPIETIKNSGLRAAAIVQDLLTIARGVAVAKEPFNINDVISSYMTSPEYHKLLHYHPAVTVLMNQDNRLFNIKGSPTHIRKVIMNLVSNAFEAVGEGGRVVISTMNRYIDRPFEGYGTFNAGEYVVFSVKDNGPGISDEDIKRIYEPFYSKKVMGRSGTGLGLTVVWNVVLDHEGHIDVVSDGQGTRFELYFPATREDASFTQASQPSLEGLRGNQEIILVIDDEANQREISCRMLELLDYKTVSVESGEAAVEYLKNNSVDLLLLDMIMNPGINGRETYERIKRMHPQQKAIIVSGFAQTDMVKETQKMGAGRYLKKPFVFDELALAIKEELEIEKTAERVVN